MSQIEEETFGLAFRRGQETRAEQCWLTRRDDPANHQRPWSKTPLTHDCKAVEVRNKKRLVSLQHEASLETVLLLHLIVVDQVSGSKERLVHSHHALEP